MPSVTYFQLTTVISRQFRIARRSNAQRDTLFSRRTSYFTFIFLPRRIANMFGRFGALVFCLLTVLMRPPGIHCRDDVNVTDVAERTENALAKLVKMFSKPGAFKQIDAILGENTIEASYTSCPMGDEGLECRRAEARRSVDCPRGDCFCYDCAAAGPDLWASCCRESLRCCSHLAAACRTCDHPTLYPFCAKHFKKCLTQYNEKRQN